MTDKKNKPTKYHGWILVDKPIGMTSTQVLGAIRRIYNPDKLGHGGTLDPFATGLLPIALGEATKTIDYCLNGSKQYEFTLRFGVATDTQDPTGNIIEQNDFAPTREEILATIPHFLGDIMQTPPKYSALKVNGQRAYNMARNGEEFTLQDRPVSIYELQLLAYNPPNATFCAKVSKGTYIRTLGVDMANFMGALGHVAQLRRTQIAHFSINQAFCLDFLEKNAMTGLENRGILGLHAGLDGILAVALNPIEAAFLRLGRPLSLISRTDFKRFQNIENGQVFLGQANHPPLYAQPELVGLLKRNGAHIIADKLFVY